MPCLFLEDASPLLTLGFAVYSIWRMAGKAHCIPQSFHGRCMLGPLPSLLSTLSIHHGAAASSAWNEDTKADTHLSDLSPPGPESEKQARLTPCWESLWLYSLIARPKLNRLRHKDRVMFGPSLHTWVAERQNQDEIGILLSPKTTYW